jgi:hypothetical protein
MPLPSFVCRRALCCLGPFSFFYIYSITSRSAFPHYENWSTKTAVQSNPKKEKKKPTRTEAPFGSADKKSLVERKGVYSKKSTVPAYNRKLYVQGAAIGYEADEGEEKEKGARSFEKEYRLQGFTPPLYHLSHTVYSRVESLQTQYKN